MEDDWDLQAVVRGCATATTNSSTTTITTTTSSTCSVDVFPISSFQPHDDHFLCFPDLFEPRNESTIEELHDLYKPFFPKQPILSPQNIPVSPLGVLGELQDLSQHHHQKQQQLQQHKQLQAKQAVCGPRSTVASVASTSTQSPRSKRRKNQLKRVCQVPAEGLSSDMWSWRKYGQKPIKGSPHPRGYYRCSTSKGCLARKQVERNKSDPSMFIVTYTAEHNHPMPTHRNSLAGSTRQKPVTPQTVPVGDTNKPSCSPPISPAASLSPVTDKTTESKEDREDMVDDEDDEFFGVSDMSDDFFAGLEELAGPTTGDYFSDNLPANLPFTWLTNNATPTAAGSS